MESIRSYVQFVDLAVEYNLKRVGINPRDERGVVATEVAVVMAALVAIAAVIGVILIGKARSNAANIPDSVPAPS